MKGRTVGTTLATAALVLSLAACGQQAADTQGDGAAVETPATQAATPVVQEGFEATTASIGADELLGRFAEPDMRDRPLTRWWVPGSQMDEDKVGHEIESMVEAGFGGAEIVPVSTAGGDGEGELDWGSDEWKAITKHILEVAGEHDFTIDFTMTPAWPLALPGITDADDPAQGAQMEMDGAHVDVEGKAGEETTVELLANQEAIDDAAAVDGTVELVGVTVARYDADGKTLLWDSAQALDLSTVKEDSDAKSVKFAPEEDGTYLVYAWYQHPAGNTKYGNIQIDHFSRAAANALTGYWDENLIPYYGDAWKSVRSLFVDSLEFETQADWTYGIQEAFEERFGYDVTPYLPAIYDEGGNWEDGNYGTRGNGELNSGNYEQTFLDHVWHDQRAFASGVNQVVFHGYPYSGAYDGGTVDGVEWPGFSGFESSRWCNSWGERQPNWMFAKTYLDFVARNQYVLRQGQPKVDVAVYRHSYYEVIDFWGPDKLFDTTSLEQAGYSYDFVAPATLALDNMAVTDGVLDADGTVYNALVVN